MRLSRKWHPDRFARASAEERQQALDASAILNDGYRALKDPIKRAEYLLKEHGFDIGEQQSKDVPPELLEEVFELNMALEESDAEAIAKAQDEVREDASRRSIEDLDAKYREYDESESREVLGESGACSTADVISRIWCKRRKTSGREYEARMNIALMIRGQR